MAELADDPPADLLDHVGDGGVGRGLALEKAWLEPLVGTIHIDPLQEEQVIVHIEIKRTPKALDKGHRPWMHLAPRDPAYDCLVDVILTNRGADDGMDCGGQVL